MKRRKPTKRELIHRKHSLAAKRGWVTRRLNIKRKSRAPSEYMWRVTIGAPYYRRTGKKRTTYKAFAYMVRSWFRTEDEAKNARGLIARAKRGRDVTLANKPNTWKINREPINIEKPPVKVPYDERLLDTIEEKDEQPR